MRRIVVNRIEPLVIEFKDGETKQALFNTECFMQFTEQYGDIQKLSQAEGVDNPYLFCSKVLHCAMWVMDRTAKLEDAQAIINYAGVGMLEVIGEVMLENFMAFADEKAQKKMERDLMKVLKTLQ